MWRECRRSLFNADAEANLFDNERNYHQYEYEQRGDTSNAPKRDGRIFVW